MQPTIAKSTNLLFVSFGILFGCIFASGILASQASAVESGAGSTVGATVCAASSTITLTAPAGDSVVTTPAVALAGSVLQSGQIEVYVDDAFNGVIPLDIGQTTYSGTVQLSPGTHTIKVVAITTCPGVNGTASSVVTYASQTTPSNGKSTPTQIGGGVTISSDPIQPATQTEPNLLPDIVTIPFQKTLQWLNINDTDNPELKSLPIWRAAVISVGLYIAIIGLAGIATTAIIQLPVVNSLMPAVGSIGRRRIVGWTFRAMGALIVIAALLV